MAVVRNNSKKMKNIKDEIKDKYTTCFFCGEFVERDVRTIDHLHSLAKGGKDEAENMVVSCHQCNSEKADLDLEEYAKLKISGFDFKARAEENKRKRGFGFEGAIYEEEILPLTSLISNPKTIPNKENIERRKKYYLENNSFLKPTFVKRRGNKYIVLQGFINYIVLTELGINEMPVTIVLNPPKCKKKTK